MVSRKLLEEQFAYFSIKVNEEVLDRCCEICTETGVGEEDFLETWMAYSVSRLGSIEPTVELVNRMCRDEYTKESRPEVPSKTCSPTESKKGGADDLMVYNPLDNISKFDDIIMTYSTTPKPGKVQLKNSSPDDSNPVPSKRPVNTPWSNGLHFSPASYSPLVTTPSAVYSERKNAGQVVCSYNVDDREEWTWSADRKKFHPQVNLGTLGNGEQQIVPFKQYMNDAVGDIAELLDSHLKWMEKWLSEALETWENEPLDHLCMVPRYYLGRICCDGNGHLNMDSLLLEGLVDSTVSGKPVPMDVSHMLSVDKASGIPKEPCEFFPGQVVVINAQNPRGQKLVTSKVYSKASAPLPSCPPSISFETGPLHVVVAAGPFTLMDTLSFEPLQDLLSYICTHQPHVVILIGPFVDISHPQMSAEGGCPLAETFDGYFDRMVNELMGRLQRLNTTVVLVASAKDGHSLPIYPTPPYEYPSGGFASQDLVSDYEGENSDQPGLIMATDPCILDIAGVIIGVTSTDILMHLGREEISSAGHTIDRLGRLSRHLIHQRNFYPLYPPALGVNTDMTLWSQMCLMSVTPHILILPSDLRSFIKDIDGCIVMNPERLAKGVCGGSFAKFEVQPSASWESSLSNNIKAQVIKM